MNRRACFRAGTGIHPDNDSPAYDATRLRHPLQPPVRVPHTLSEITGPGYRPGRIRPLAADLTRQHPGAPLGERIIVSGTIKDENGEPVPETLVEVWQANAAGRYAHDGDTHDAPLDPNFTGSGRVLSDREGRYRIVTIGTSRSCGNSVCAMCARAAWRPWPPPRLSAGSQGVSAGSVRRPAKPSAPWLPRARPRATSAAAARWARRTCASRCRPSPRRPS